MRVSKIETAVVMLVCVLISAVTGKLFYDIYLMGLFLLVPLSLFIFREYKKMKRKRYEKRFTYQFEEMLECLVGALRAGYSLENAFFETKKQMIYMYGSDIDVIRELDIICHGIKVNIPVEKLMDEMAMKVNISIVTDYAQLLHVAKRYGGNLIEITKQNVNILREKRMIHDEIETMITGKKCECIVMNIMPVGILLYLKITSYEMVSLLYTNLLGNVIMTVLLAGYIATLVLGNRIMSFENSNINKKSKSKRKYSIRKNRYPWILRKLNKTYLKAYVDSINEKITVLNPYMNNEYEINCFWRNFFGKTVLGIVVGISFCLYGFLYDKKSALIYVFIAAVLSCVFPYTMISGLKKRMSIRKSQMDQDYPELIDKLILYLGAGMSMKGCFARLTKEYEIRKKEKKTGFRYVYEEISSLVRQLKNGISETNAYESFGKRCCNLSYMRLTTLLVQNLKKGNAGMLEKLRITSLDAFEERKMLMKKCGEKASSKLLLPMMIQFAIILVFIMYPAMAMSR